MLVVRAEPRQLIQKADRVRRLCAVERLASTEDKALNTAASVIERRVYANGAGGIARNGVASVREALTPSDVSLRIPIPKYMFCLACSPPRQLVRSPLCAGSSSANPDAGFCF